MPVYLRIDIQYCMPQYCTPLCVSLAVFLTAMMMQALTRRNTWGILQECRLLTSPLRPLSTAPIKRFCQPSSHSHGCSRLCSERLFARCLSSGPVASPADLRSTRPDVEIPNISFAEFICNRCDQFKDRLALVSVRALSLSSSPRPPLISSECGMS